MTVLQNIKINIPEKQILRRLAYNKHKTHIPEKITALLQKIIEEALLLIEPKGIYGKFRVTEKGDATITGYLEKSQATTVIESNNIRKLLDTCDYFYIFGCSVGNEIIDRLNEYKKQGKLTEAVILDACASEMVDSVADEVNKAIDYEALTIKYKTTPRFSPGYGDFSLSYQKEIENLIDLNRIGIKVKENLILEPEKSITALLGMKK